MDDPVECRPTSSNGPVFIVGMNGSGTTMMLDHLGHHPDLFGFKLETYILPHYLLNERRYGNLAVDRNYLKLWNDMRSEYPFRRANSGAPVELPNDWAMAPRCAATVFDRIMRTFARVEGKERWCEKTPMYALHLDLLAKAFPASRFVHMVRDGRDCAVSNHRRWGRSPENTIYRWKQVVGEGQRQGALLGKRYFELKYEDLTDEPETHMRRVCDFIGIAFDQRIMQASRPRLRVGSRGTKSIVKIQNRNLDYLSDSRLASLERISGKRLASLGYATRYPDGDCNPVLARRIWWFAHDATAVLKRQLKNKVTVQKRMTWSLFFARLKAIIRLDRDVSQKKGAATRKQR